MKKVISVGIIIVAIMMLMIGGIVFFIDSKKITISFITNNDYKLDSIKIKEGESINLPTLEREGYEFLGWYVNNEKIDSNYKFDKTTLLSAKWKKNDNKTNSEEKNGYNVTFESNGGSSVQNQIISEGEKVEKPTNPTKSGYRFIEWQLDGKTYDFNNAITKDITLVAKWEKVSTTDKTYTVTFDTCISSEKVPIQIVKEGELATQPVTPKSLEENFCGWWLSPGSEFDFSTPITSDITLEICQGTKYSYRLCSGGGGSGSEGSAGKPIIYLYPEKEMDVEVKLGNIDGVTTIYPKYNNGWKVKASPDGTLINKDNGRKLYSLYWEGKNYPVKVEREGFVIKGEDTAKFLEEKLEILGLNEIESEEFIIYWLPKMEHNKYNYIRFATREKIDKYMPLEINPKPDTVIRIMMEFKGLNEKINVKEQKLIREKRQGFTIIEWGGSLINEGIIR